MKDFIKIYFLFVHHLCCIKYEHPFGPFQRRVQLRHLFRQAHSKTLHLDRLRRKKQFAMIGPATKTQVEVGLNVQELADAERLTTVKAGGMCNYKIRLSDPAEADEQLISWLRQAYERAN